MEQSIVQRTAPSAPSKELRDIFLMSRPFRLNQGGELPVLRLYVQSPRTADAPTKTIFRFLTDAFTVHQHFERVFHRAGGSDLARVDEEDFIGIGNRV
jgi:hypothetical protein